MTKPSIAKLVRSRLAPAALLILASCSSVAQATESTMFRDPGCGCCHEWADHVEGAMAMTITTVDRPNMPKVKKDHAIPAELVSCHTMLVEGYVIEGHVPADAIEKLLRERPAGVTGLAVPGMPLGSPGMEVEGQAQPFEVIAFGPAGQQVFANYN